MYTIAKALLALTLLLGLNFDAWGQGAPPPGSSGPHQYEGGELYRMTTQQTASLPSVEFGESWNQDTGAVSFSQTDVSIPGNNSLPVAITRTRSRNPIALFTDGMFGDWELSLPRVEYSWRKGAAEQYYEATRCQTPQPASLYGSPSNGHIPYAFFFGLTIFDFNGDGHLMMQPGTSWPSTALGAAPALTTKSLWKVSCLPNATNGHDGFLATSPDGTTYRFDREIHRRTNKTVLENILVSIYPSVVTDVHGNTVTYTYGTHGPTRIEASDGRLITLTYNGAGQITQVQANGRTWQYTYATESYNYSPVTSRTLLSKVKRPDNEEWTFNGFKNLDWANTPEQDYLDCTLLPNWGGIGWRPPHTLGDVTVTHPNGSELVLKLRATKNGRTGGATRTTPNYWYTSRCKTSAYILDNYFVSMAVEEKRYELSDGATHIWTYTYEEDEGNYVTQTNLANVKKRTILNPDGSRVELDIDRVTNSPFEGLLKQRRIYANASSGSAIETETTTISLSSFTQNSILPQPYNSPAVYGASTVRAMVLRPVEETEITRGSDSYTTTYSYELSNASDFSHENPVQISQTSNLGHGTRTTDLTYENKTGSWVLFLPEQQDRNGKEFSRFTYDNDGSVTQWRRFGATWRTFTWASDGTMSSAKDALNRTTTYANFKRGYPRQITQPDNTTFSFVVDNNGWVTSATNPRGFTLGMDYNSMGWLTEITRPTPWADTTISYTFNSNGIVATETRGNSRTVTTHDGMNRPMKIQSIDLSGGVGSRYVKQSYDGLGRQTFVSFPSTSNNPATGTENTYDALGRVTQVRENVSPFATTSTTYLSNNRVQVSGPSGAITTTKYRAFGSPATDEAIEVVDPSNSVTTMTRDVYGNITNLNQFSTLNGNTINIDRKFWYDARLRLCRHQAPEFGDELFAYDSADQLTQSSRGESASTGCGTPSASLRTSFNYDSMGRQTLINFPSGTDDIVKTYDSNGNETRNVRGGIIWDYAYDALDAISQEELSIDGNTFTFNYTRDQNGYVATRSSPSGLLYSFAPNGFGEPTQLAAGGTSHIDNVTYHPNGMVASGEFANGQDFSQTLTARQQPLRSITQKPGSYKATDLQYTYDVRGKVASITDHAQTSYNQVFTYNPVGRLLTASGNWGTGRFKYDGAGNIREKRLGTRYVEMAYNANNQLDWVVDTANPTRTFVHDARGNVTDDGRYDYVYDAANQPTSVDIGPATLPSEYDGNLKRVKNVFRNGSGANRTVYTAYSRVSGTPIYRLYSTGLQFEFPVDIGPLSVWFLNGNFHSYRHLDHLGSVLAVTHTSGTSSNYREQYTPFGERLIETSNHNNPSYTGHARDMNTNLYYMQARNYDPVIGRFLSTDPIGYRDQINQYAYVANDPINGTDPTGLERFEFDQRNQAIQDGVQRATVAANLQSNAATQSELRSDTLDSFQAMGGRANNLERQGFSSNTLVGGVKERSLMDKIIGGIMFSSEEGNFSVIGSELQSSNGFLSAPGDNAYGSGGGAILNTVRSEQNVGSNPIDFENAVEQISGGMQNLANRTGNITIGTIENSGPTRNPEVRSYVFTPDK